MGRLVEGAEDPKLYEDLGDYEVIRKISDEVLEEYNVEHKPMNLVLFESRSSTLPDCTATQLPARPHSPRRRWWLW